MIIKILLITLVLLFSGCSHRKARVNSVSVEDTSKNKTAHTHTKNSISTNAHKSVKKSHPTMRPYVVKGKKYYPTIVNVGDKLYGRASWYGPKFHGRLTANGETYNMWAMTAAHKTLPMNTIVRVTNKGNGKSTVVRINDRGPFVGTRILDLSKGAASKLDMISSGTASVTLEIIGFQEDGKKKIPTNRELANGQKNKIVASYAVQIASFSKINGAIVTQEKYEGLDGYHTIIKDTGEGDSRLFRVWLTGFKSEQEARDFIASGKTDYAFIVSE